MNLKELFTTPDEFRYMDKVLKLLRNAPNHSLSPQELHQKLNIEPNIAYFEKIGQKGFGVKPDISLNLIMDDGSFLNKVLSGLIEHNMIVPNVKGLYELKHNGFVKILNGGFTSEHRIFKFDKVFKWVLWFISIVGFVFSTYNFFCD